MSNSESDLLAELQIDFLNEVTFDLEKSEESYLKLEIPELRSDELAKIFRIAHSIKGAGSAVGFQDLASFAHVVEDCLTFLRAYPDLLDSDIISVLLKVSDAFKYRVGMLLRKDPNPWDNEALKAEVVQLTQELEDKINSGKYKIRETPSVSTVLPTTPMVPSTVPSTSSEHAREASVIKIDSSRVDSVMNLVGELIVTKSQLMNLVSEQNTDGKLMAIVTLMDKTIRELQDRTLSMRMTPLKPMFVKTQRIIRDIAIKLNKQVDLQMAGEDTEIDRTMVEMLSDPLMHMIRNSMDHGIESPDVRKAKGKSIKGVVRVLASQEGGQVVVRIQDDGGGIDREKVIAKAIKNNLIDSSIDPSKLSDRQVFEMLCLPGFSTAEKITDLSGRGVGMDVVKTNIEKMRGKLDIQSKLGEGSSFTISLPLTTSITDGMLVEFNHSQFILPVGSIRELMALDLKKVVALDSHDFVLNHREGIYPLVDMGSLISQQSHRYSFKPDSMVILVEAGGEVIGFVVDRVVGQAQVVLKPLGDTFKSDQGVVGGAIMGDGKVALVLDPLGVRDFHYQMREAS